MRRKERKAAFRNHNSDPEATASLSRETWDEERSQSQSQGKPKFLKQESSGENSKRSHPDSDRVSEAATPETRDERIWERGEEPEKPKREAQHSREKEGSGRGAVQVKSGTEAAAPRRGARMHTEEGRCIESNTGR